MQATYAGWVRGGKGGSVYDVWQANRIVAGGDKKVNVVCEPNEDYVRTLATDLAAFLGVPPVDQIAEVRKHYGQ